MKITANEPKKEFKPFDVTFTFETEDDVRRMLNAFYVSDGEDKVVNRYGTVSGFNCVMSAGEHNNLLKIVRANGVDV